MVVRPRGQTQRRVGIRAAKSPDGHGFAEASTTKTLRPGVAGQTIGMSTFDGSRTQTWRFHKTRRARGLFLVVDYSSLRLPGNLVYEHTVCIFSRVLNTICRGPITRLDAARWAISLCNDPHGCQSQQGPSRLTCEAWRGPAARGVNMIRRPRFVARQGLSPRRRLPTRRSQRCGCCSEDFRCDRGLCPDDLCIDLGLSFHNALCRRARRWRFAGRLRRVSSRLMARVGRPGQGSLTVYLLCNGRRVARAGGLPRVDG